MAASFAHNRQVGNLACSSRACNANRPVPGSDCASAWRVARQSLAARCPIVEKTARRARRAGPGRWCGTGPMRAWHWRACSGYRPTIFVLGAAPTPLAAPDPKADIAWTRRFRPLAKPRRNREIRPEEVVRLSHSMTSSARARIAGGIVRPSSFAVLRLMTSWKVVGCCTGISAGSAPFKICPV
jgi:hypothetical protein